MIPSRYRPSSSFRSSSDRFRDVASCRKGRCRREENDYRDLGPGKYDGSSMMELQQSRPKTRGSILGGSGGHRSVVPRAEVNWYPGRKDYPNLGPGVYHQASRSFLTKTDAIMFLPGSRRGFHSFLNSGRSKRLMGDAVLFKTARADGEHLGPGSYDLPPTLDNGRRPSTAPEASLRVKPQQTRPRSRLRRAVSSTSSVNGTGCLKGSVGADAGLYMEEEEERAAAVNAVRALPELHVRYGD
ncbi:unnamed protein product [Ectocarpus sp. 4 AP-2014]